MESRRLLAADAILHWNAIMLQADANDHALAAPDQGGPVLAARAFAIVSAGMYDAYNSVEHLGPAYLTMTPAATNADAQAAVAQAAHDTLAALFPAQQATFGSQLEAYLGEIPDGDGEAWGRLVGAHVAEQLLAARSTDGVDFIGMSYEPSLEMGFHDVDPLNPDQGFYAPGAMDIAPFAISDVSHFAAPRLDDGTPAGRMAFMQSAEYTEAYNEVLAMGSDGVSAPTMRTAEQTNIGLFWAYDGRPGVGTPPRFLNQITHEIAAQEGNTEAENARLFTLVNLALGDAGVASWNTKYVDAFWRPIMGIRYGEADGNPATVGQSDWCPLGAPVSNPQPGEINFTPPFPAYTSGHATFGAAAFQMLANYYGRDDISFTVVSDELNGQTLGSDGQPRPFVERTFNSFTEAKIENSESRIYLGIHWRFDAEEGVRQGDAIADYVFDAVLDGRYNLDPADYPWHHAALPTDVDGLDGTTFSDALLIVNHLRDNRGESLALAPVLDSAVTAPWFDVKPDNLVTLSDVLKVVSHLRQQRELSEGEPLRFAEPESRFSADPTAGAGEQTSMDTGAAVEDSAAAPLATQAVLMEFATAPAAKPPAESVPQRIVADDLESEFALSLDQAFAELADDDGELL